MSSNISSKSVYVENKGRSLIANDNIKQYGSLISQEAPYIFVPFQENMHMHKFDEFSLQPFELEVLNEGKRHCGDSFSCNSSILGARLLIKLFSEKDSEVLDLYDKLVYSKKVNDSIDSAALIVYRLLTHVGVNKDINQCRIVLSKLSSNAFTVTNAFGIRIGIALYLKSSQYNHSCNPNCFQSFDNNGNLCIRNIREIVKNEELTISYIEILQSTEIRRRILQETYNFYCHCEYCISNHCGDTCTYIKCLKCNSGYFDLMQFIQQFLYIHHLCQFKLVSSINNIVSNYHKKDDYGIPIVYLWMVQILQEKTSFTYEVFVNCSNSLCKNILDCDLFLKSFRLIIENISKISEAKSEYEKVVILEETYTISTLRLRSWYFMHLKILDMLCSLLFDSLTGATNKYISLYASKYIKYSSLLLKYLHWFDSKSTKLILMFRRIQIGCNICQYESSDCEDIINQNQLFSWIQETRLTSQHMFGEAIASELYEDMYSNFRDSKDNKGNL